jgi:hypothetical protein
MERTAIVVGAMVGIARERKRESYRDRERERVRERDIPVRWRGQR